MDLDYIAVLKFVLVALPAAIAAYIGWQHTYHHPLVKRSQRTLTRKEALQDRQFQRYIAEGEKVYAMKRYRELTGASLNEALQTVEEYLS